MEQTRSSAKAGKEKRSDPVQSSVCDLQGVKNDEYVKLCARSPQKEMVAQARTELTAGRAGHNSDSFEFFGYLVLVLHKPMRNKQTQYLQQDENSKCLERLNALLIRSIHEAAHVRGSAVPCQLFPCVLRRIFGLALQKR
jgi:hypothetical protein